MFAVNNFPPKFNLRHRKSSRKQPPPNLHILSFAREEKIATKIVAAKTKEQNCKSNNCESTSSTTKPTLFEQKPYVPYELIIIETRLFVDHEPGNGH